MSLDGHRELGELGNRTRLNSSAIDDFQVSGGLKGKAWEVLGPSEVVVDKGEACSPRVYKGLGGNQVSGIGERDADNQVLSLHSSFLDDGS